jgi:hypothetical protein
VSITFGIAIKLLRSAHHLIKVITCAKLFKKKRFKSYGADMKCILFILLWHEDFFYIWPFYVTLTLGVATQLFLKKIFSGKKIVERPRHVYILLWNEDFLTFDLLVSPWPWGSNQIIALCTSFIIVITCVKLFFFKLAAV